MNALIPVQAAEDLIRSGRQLALAGTEQALARLPAGQWIGGTIPYFMVDAGGTVVGDDRVFVTDLSDVGTVSVAWYGADALADISGRAPDNGFSLTIIPAGSPALISATLALMLSITSSAFCP